MLHITKEFTFDSAHHLSRPDLSPEENKKIFGICTMPHGHTYRLRTTVSGSVDKNGMILNFCALKSIVTRHILSRYDHTDLNTLPEYQATPPTAEAMAQFIFDTLTPVLKTDRYHLSEVIVFETPTAWATVTSDA